MQKKANYLLLEILICLTLIALFGSWIFLSPSKVIRQEAHRIEKEQSVQIAQEAFAKAKIALFEKTYTLTELKEGILIKQPKATLSFLSYSDSKKHDKREMITVQVKIELASKFQKKPYIYTHPFSIRVAKPGEIFHPQNTDEEVP